MKACRVWVLGLTAGTGQYGSESNSMYAIFAIYMTLTKEGLEHLFEVSICSLSYDLHDFVVCAGN